MLARVIFDRRLRTPASARVLSTLEAGPVIIVTSSRAAQARAADVAALVGAGATVVPVEGDRFGDALTALRPFPINALLLEGGAALHAAAWDEDLVDAVHLYIAPVTLGPGGVPLLAGRAFSLPALVDPEIGIVGPDTCIQGYVHRAD